MAWKKQIPRRPASARDDKQHHPRCAKTNSVLAAIANEPRLLRNHSHLPALSLGSGHTQAGGDARIKPTAIAGVQGRVEWQRGKKVADRQVRSPEAGSRRAKGATCAVPHLRAARVRGQSALPAPGRDQRCLVRRERNQAHGANTEQRHNRKCVPRCII